MGVSPLLIAVARETGAYAECARLLKAGADPNEESGCTEVPRDITALLPLHEALLRGLQDIVHLLLENGADPFAQSSVTFTRAVHWARLGASRCNTPEAHATLYLFESMTQIRYQNYWSSLKKELLEAVWHPARLARLGYFDADDDDDREIIFA